MPAALDSAGASARREHERRRANDEARIREKWGRLGGLAVALSDERQSTAAWNTGATGEERVGAALNAVASDRIRMLHDRRIPGTRANIDHIVTSPAGVWVVDAKKYKGRPRRQIDGGLFSPRVEKLTVGGRDQTKLVDGVLKQVELVRSVASDIEVTGVLCFVDADWPLIGGSFRVRGVEVVWPKLLVRMLRKAPDAGVDVGAMMDAIDGRFRPA
jgi:hypothetical protein